MKKTCLLIALAVVAIVSCNKTTNNTTVIAPLPAFTVNGIHDISLQNGGSYYGVSLPITVQYSDSAQEVVTLSLSALPPGIAIDTTWVTSGIPTFNTTLTFIDSTAAGATPGNYPMTLTATGSSTKTKTYSFNLKVIAQPSCADSYTGTYTHCTSYCYSGSYYADNITADATIPNKIWLNNVNNAGTKIYAMVNCNSSSISIPNQVSGGVIYYGSGVAYTSHQLSFNLYNSNTGNYCSISMN